MIVDMIDKFIDGIRWVAIYIGGIVGGSGTAVITEIQAYTAAGVSPEADLITVAFLAKTSIGAVIGGTVVFGFNVLLLNYKRRIDNRYKKPNKTKRHE